MKSFLTRVMVGEFSAEGEGNSKKLSKKRAALSILQELKKLPVLPVVEKPKVHYKKRPKTILKVGCFRSRSKRSAASLRFQSGGCYWNIISISNSMHYYGMYFGQSKW